jgi:hypothetical protein
MSTLPEGNAFPLAAHAFPNALPPPLVQPLGSILFINLSPWQAEIEPPV